MQMKNHMSKTNEMNFPTRRSMLMYFLKGNIRFFVLSVILAVVMSGLDLINPRIIAFTVDSVLGDKEPEVPGFVLAFIEKMGGMEYLRSHLWLIALAVVLVALGAALGRYLFRLFNAMGGEGLVRRMREKLYDHIVHLPLSWHNRNQTGDIIQRCTSDVDTIRNFLAEQLVTLVRVIILIALAIFFMLQLNTKLTLVAILLIPVIVGYSLVFHNKIGESFLEVDNMEGRLSAMVQENLTGVRVVRAFGREAYERERFEKSNEEYMNTWIHLMKLLSAFWATGDLASGLQVLLIAGVGAVFCVHGEITAGEYIAFISYNAMLTWPVRMLGRVISEMSKSGVSIDRICYIMNSPVEQDAEDALTPDMRGDIVFDHVSFTYDAESEEGKSAGVQGAVLEDVSFTVKAGTTVGILGGTGSGKSTLLHLLDHLYDLEEGQGRVTIGGVDVRKIKLDHLRRNIGIVLQEPYLFSGTLAENIALTQDTLEMPSVKAAAKVAALHESVKKFSKGYETYVGERGVTLSGGQKQRTAIAQMLIRKPPIMIFDDSLSAVDAETDARIRRGLAQEVQGATTLLIAHRISTLMNADRIVVLDHGRVAEEGTHEELLARNGIYSRIYHLQQPAEE